MTLTNGAVAIATAECPRSATDEAARRGLTVLSCTEIFERFSYAGMRAILVLYLTDSLLVGAHYEKAWGLARMCALLEHVYGHLSTAALALQIYGLYVGLFYFTALLGGVIADRLLGARYTVLIGAGLMSIAQFCLATDLLFLPGLLLMVVGGGLFKPNISAQVGGLFDASDRRGEKAFAIFYVAINVGTFFAPLVCGTLGERVGWHAGFLAAGIGMTLGTSIYIIGWNSLPANGRGRSVQLATLAVKRSALEKSRVKALILLAALVPLFWVAYEQKSGAVILWARHSVDLRFFGVSMPVSWILMLNPLFIFIMTPLLNGLWNALRRWDAEPSSVAKMCFGYLLLAAAFLILAFAAHQIQSDVSVLWVALFMLVLTTGELLVAAVGLSLFGRLAPPGIVCILLALWFFATFIGNYGSGMIAAAAIDMPRAEYFACIAALPAAAAIVLVLSKQWLTRSLENTRDDAHATGKMSRLVRRFRRGVAPRSN